MLLSIPGLWRTSDIAGGGGGFLYFLRMLLDLQNKTIYRDLRPVTSCATGMVLDVGCGQSPYRHLVERDSCTYRGIDIEAADEFDYQNADVVRFDGENIPFPESTFDLIICTEVLEHVHRYEKLVEEMHRVLKPNGTIIATVPWSARFHYVPHDYFRYTPSTLAIMFAGFSNVRVSQRGNEICVIANKMMVLTMAAFRQHSIRSLPLKLLSIILLPFTFFLWIAAHATLILGWEDSLDPLGYTVIASK